MFRISIIDITGSEIAELEQALRTVLANVRVIARSMDCRTGISQIEDYHPDLVFLNITMMGEADFELLKQTEFQNFLLVYTAPDSRHSLKALKNKAFDYLLKPVFPADIAAVFGRIRKKQQPDELTRQPELQRKLPIHANKEFVIYEPTSNILRLEADSNYTQIMLEDKRKFLVSKTLKHYEMLLCTNGFSFMRVHHSYIINLNYVVRFLKEEQGVIVMKDNFMVPLSKAKRNDFMRWLEP